MPRKDASSHRTKSSKRNTKHKSKDKKEEIKKDKKQQFANDQQQINSMQKRKPKDFGITYEIRKRIKDEERNWFWTFGIWNTWNGENVVTNKDLKFAFA